MVYPILLTVIAAFIITVMLVFVVPKVVGVFETTGQELPMLTRVLIAMSNLVQNWWFLLLAAIVPRVISRSRGLLRQRAHSPARALLAAASADLRPRDARAQYRAVHAHA